MCWPRSGSAWPLSKAVPQYDSHKHDLREQRGPRSVAVQPQCQQLARGEGRREELQGKRVSTQA